MIRIQIPNNNIPEREYIINILLSDFLGLECTIVPNNSELHYSIIFEGSELIIKDSFFSRYPNILSYLNADAFPGRILYIKNEFTVDKDIPLLYGTDELQIYKNKIICGLDIFASSFLMLTRWEEYVNKTRDTHDRFPGSSSIAYKNNFLHRPIVNEYVEMLWNMMQKLGYKGEKKQRKFELVLTHDVDHLDYPGTHRIILGDILKRRNPKLARKHFKYFLSGSNPYDYFDFLMSTSESIGLKSHFYFMSSFNNLHPDPSCYLETKRFISKIREIKQRGHIIGFHPGYYTFDDNKRWSSEKQRLEEAVKQDINEGRQHYLRMDVTKTLPIWDKNNMKIDSTLSFTDKEGFRCGTGNIFHVFDFLARTQLCLKERPLILMDGTLRQYQQYSQDQVLQIVQNYISIGKRYNTLITLLFHNSSFYEEWEGYDAIYKNILSYSN